MLKKTNFPVELRKRPPLAGALNYAANRPSTLKTAYRYSNGICFSIVISRASHTEHHHVAYTTSTQDKAGPPSSESGCASYDVPLWFYRRHTQNVESLQTIKSQF